MRGNIKILMFGMMLIMISLVSSANPYGGITILNNPIELKQECFINGTICDSCNITSISFPNRTTIISNVEMTKRVMDFNYTFTNTSAVGEYDVRGYCVYGSDVAKPFTGYFIVNYTGNKETTSGAILHFVALIILFLFFVISLIGSIKIPFKNYKNPEGVIIGVNELKYLKIILIVITYILLMFIFGISRRIAEIYLLQEGIKNVFNWMFWILFSFLFPILIISFILIIIYVVDNKKIRNSLNRGIPIR